MQNPPRVEDQPHEVLEEIDVRAGRKLASRKDHPIVRCYGKLGEIGDQGPLYLIGCAITARGLFKNDARSLAAGLSMIAAVGVADIIKRGVKANVRRTRPREAITRGDYQFETGGSSDGDEQSFPSGHTACTLAATETIGWFYPKLTPYLRGTAMLMSCSRVAKGSHWPLDLATGGVIGVISHRFAKRLIPPFTRLSFAILRKKFLREWAQEKR